MRHQGRGYAKWFWSTQNLPDPCQVMVVMFGNKISEVNDAHWGSETGMQSSMR
jgi:hypothetical protein